MHYDLKGKTKNNQFLRWKNACSRLCVTGFYENIDNVDNLEALNIIRQVLQGKYKAIILQW